jgi:uncharacterized phage-associated protein
MRERAPTAEDVAAAIIEAIHPRPMKLQKLLYFANAWNLAWFGERMFPDVIEAWEQGPVIDRVYQQYKHLERAAIEAPLSGNASVLGQRDKYVIEAVLSGYGQLSGPQLSDLTHKEPAWREAWARRRMPFRGRQAIDLDRVRETRRRNADFGGKTHEAGDPTAILRNALGR